MTRSDYRDYTLAFAAGAALMGHLAYTAPSAWWFWFNTAAFVLATGMAVVAFRNWRRA